MESSKDILFTPIKLGDLELPNRIACSALGRARADKVTRVPNSLHAESYSQKASAAIIFTECSAVSPDGDTYIGSADIYSPEQVEGWKKVVEAVHAKGGRIFIQLWHGGRTAHPDRNGGVTPISSSPIAVNAEPLTP